MVRCGNLIVYVYFVCECVCERENVIECVLEFMCEREHFMCISPHQINLCLSVRMFTCE